MRHLVLLALGLCACEPPALVRPKESSDAGTQCLGITPVIDFGERENFTQSNLALVVDNPNPFTAQLSIGDVAPPFTVSTFLSNSILFIGPHTTLSIGVTFQPTDGRLALADLVVNTDVPQNCPPTTVRLSGLGSGDLLVPQLVQLPPAPIGGTSASVITLRNLRREPVTVDVRVGFANFDGGGGPFGPLTLPPRVQVPALSTLDVPVQFMANSPGVQRTRVEFQPSIGFVTATTVEAISGMPHAVQNQPQLVIDPLPTVLNARRLLHLQNAGDGLLRLSNVRVVPGPGALADEAQAQLISFSDVGPGSSAKVVIDFTPRHEGAARWTVQVDTNEPAQPTLSWDVQATIVPTPSCVVAVEGSPSSLSVQGPYPATADVTFTNPGNAPCLVTALGFTSFTTWSSDLGNGDTFSVDAGASVTHTFTFAGPGASFLQWASHGTNLRNLAVNAN